MIARWPGVIESGKRTNALVQYADVLPTLLDLTGSKTNTLDGSSFVKVLHGKTNIHRKYVYGMHNNFPEGPPYPSRTISDGDFRLILNLTAE